jgi:hypothetical protein
MQKIIQQLNEARREAQKELERINQALSVLQRKGNTHSKRKLSAAARKRIGDAQRKRWRLIRGGKKAA